MTFRTIDSCCYQMKTKWGLNQEYFYQNLKNFERVFPGMYVTIVSGKVKIVTYTIDNQFRALHRMAPDEKEEAYTNYVRGLRGVFI